MTHELYTPQLASLRQQLAALDGRLGEEKKCRALRNEIKKLEKTEVGPRLAVLKTRLKASTGKAGYEKRCEGLKKEIARLEAIQSKGVKSHD